MITLPILLLITIIISCSIIIYLFKILGYRLCHQDWMIEKEKEWMAQLEETYEKMYEEEFTRLLDQLDHSKDEIKFLEGTVNKANEQQKKLHLSFCHFLCLLIEDSYSEKFLKRYPTTQSVRQFYNKSLNCILQITEKDFELMDKTNNKKSYAQRMLKKAFSQDPHQGIESKKMKIITEVI